MTMTDKDCVELLKSVAGYVQIRREEAMLNRRISRTRQREIVSRYQMEEQAVAYAIGRIDQLDRMQTSEDHLTRELEGIEGLEEEGEETPG
jgi:hypothetical protein